MNLHQITISVLMLAIMLAIGYPVFHAVDGEAGYLRWNNDHPALVEQFEDECNQRFGYEWEYQQVTEDPIDSSDGYDILCFKDTGFASGTGEEITVNASTNHE